MNIQYRVGLSQSERDQFTALLSAGTHPARKLKQAQAKGTDAPDRRLRR